MKVAFDTLKAHLERTGRVKMLPKILRELKQREAREIAQNVKKETAHENPSLISGWRSIENGVLTDTTGKRALLEIYQKVIS
jgi:hypothetical protein